MRMDFCHWLIKIPFNSIQLSLLVFPSARYLNEVKDNLIRWIKIICKPNSNFSLSGMAKYTF